ncbi:MAG: FAD-dependent oxidoreductase, partial [Chromatiales bacterium]|nr:FAD-dependent oxidoreductase [Chromatiales bacterium]
GGGFSGHTAPFILAGPVVFVGGRVARGRWGGRFGTLPFGRGGRAAGGTEIGSGYARIRDMAARVSGGLELESWMATVQLPVVLNIDGQLVTMPSWSESALNRLEGSERPLPPPALVDHFAPRPSPLQDLDSWLSPEAANLDIPYSDYLRSHGASEEALRLIARDLPSLDTASMSALWQHRSDRAFGLMGGVTGLDRLVAGSSRLTEGMAAALRREIRMNAHVVALRTDERGVTVTDRGGRRYTANHVVCTVPLPLLREISIEPGLPALMAEAIREIPYGAMTSVYFTVKERYWEVDGMAPGLWGTGSFGNILPFTTRHGDYLWMIIKEPAWGALSEQEVKQRALAELTEIRPSTVGRIEPSAVVNWTSYPWLKGHTVFRRPGQIARYGNNIAEPHGRIHFAGEHTAVTMLGMEAAMESGERAAFEVLQRI